ncbi:MAG TPA: hypothetical protein V6D12_06145 [Candidatus Obscuribacterales bacterium]
MASNLVRGRFKQIIDGNAKIVYQTAHTEKHRLPFKNGFAI